MKPGSKLYPSGFLVCFARVSCIVNTDNRFQRLVRGFGNCKGGLEIKRLEIKTFINLLFTMHLPHALTLDHVSSSFYSSGVFMCFV
jgi:hypothetical protein